MKINKKAFSILNIDEKASLSFKRLQGKSSWQAGEIMKKSHYKYLEINTRAETFFRVFQEHYNLYDGLIPEGLKLKPDFAKYITLCIETRKKISEVTAQIDNELYQKQSTRDPLVSKEILALKNSKSIHALNLYSVLMEFDRYNNFRVLPREVQEPSGFKRRNKTRYRKHLMISVGLEPYSLFRIKEIFTQKSKKLTNEGFVALMNFPETQEVIRVNAGTETLDRLSKISLYIFKHEDKAQEYMELVFDYLNQPKKDPRKGLQFWPNFRNLIKESLNYNLVNNIAPNRRALHEAIIDMDRHYKKKQNLDNYKKSFK